jgi:hypothetical protein
MTQYYQNNPHYQNNPQQYQQYAQSWDQGTYNQIPEDQARQQYQHFVQNAPPQAIEQVHQQYYNQMPPQQRTNFLQGLVSALTQQGYDPRQAGIQTTDPNRMSPQDAARLTAYAQQQQPDILHQLFGPGGPLGSTGAKLAVAGLAALAAKHFLGGSGFDFGGGGNNFGGGSSSGSTSRGSTITGGNNANNGGDSIL